MEKVCDLYNRMCINCCECDICDLDGNKTCDNCGKCIDGSSNFRTVKFSELLSTSKEKTDTSTKPKKVYKLKKS